MGIVSCSVIVVFGGGMVIECMGFDICVFG